MWFWVVVLTVVVLAGIVNASWAAYKRYCERLLEEKKAMQERERLRFVRAPGRVAGREG